MRTSIFFYLTKLLLCGFVWFLYAGMKPSSMIVWDENRKLTWNDFQGDADYRYSDVSALSASGIIHFKGCEDGKIICEVKAYFETGDSWVKAEALTDYHLAHEQLHFDITELYARKLRKALEMRTFRCDEQEAFDDFVQQYINLWQKAQINYDMNTHYSMKPKIQSQWEHLVAVEMSVYDKFK